MASRALTFDSLEDEVRYLRGLIAVQRLADEVLEDCLERQLGLEAAADVFLGQCARMIHARGAFVQLRGTDGPVLTRVWGTEHFDTTGWSRTPGAYQVTADRTVFIAGLTLGRLDLGTIGFLVPGHFPDGGPHVQQLVEAIAEMFDSSVLAFLALSEGLAPLERLDELIETGDFRPRARIGRYELLQPLGTGGMAQVMVARTVNPGGVSRLVAFKRILPRLADDEAMVRQFHDEARLGMLLSHPNLVTTYDFGNAAGSYFIAMELVKGVDFDQLIYWRHGRLPLPLVSAIVCQALEGLHSAHELKSESGEPLGLVHRDLSPHNMMVGFDGRVKVLDFGVAKMRDQRTVTLPGIVKGKPLYMSPEQATAERMDRRSDLFAIGLILYEALMGERAFDRKDDTKTMEAIVNDPLPRPPSIGLDLWEVLSKALAKDPDQRCRNALELASALRDVVPPMSVEKVGELVSTHFPNRRREVEAWERTRSKLAAATTLDD